MIGDSSGGTPSHLRRAQASDAQPIATVFASAVREGWAYLGELVLRPMFPPEYWDGLIVEHGAPNALFVAIDDADDVVGFSAIHANDGELFLLFVDPAYGGRGVGRALLGASHDELRAAGHTEAFLFTEERNTRARAFYAAAGYRPDGTIRESDFQGAALRELRLVKAL